MWQQQLTSSFQNRSKQETIKQSIDAGFKLNCFFKDRQKLDITAGYREPIIMCCSDTAVSGRGSAPDFVLIGPEGKVLSWANHCWGLSTLNKGKPGLQPDLYEVLYTVYIFLSAVPAVLSEITFGVGCYFVTVFVLVFEAPT